MDRRSFLLLGAAGVVPLGCVSKPKMQLHYARVSSAGPAGIGMDIFLRVNNQNSFDVQVRNVRVRTVLQGRYSLPPISYSPNQWLAADGTTIVRSPVIIPWPMVMPLLAETVAFSEIRYRVRGGGGCHGNSLSWVFAPTTIPLTKRGACRAWRFFRRLARPFLSLAESGEVVSEALTCGEAAKTCLLEAPCGLLGEASAQGDKMPQEQRFVIAENRKPVAKFSRRSR